MDKAVFTESEGMPEKQTLTYKPQDSPAKPKELMTLIAEIKLSVNNRLYKKGVISEDMYTRAKEQIVRGK